MFWLTKILRSVSPTKAIPPRKRPKRALLNVETLEDRVTPSVTVQFDFSRDTSNFFADSGRRQVLQTAADNLTSRLTDNLAAIPTPTTGNSWQAVFTDPSNGNNTVSLTNLQVPADKIIVYVGGRTFGNGTRGEANTGFRWAGTLAWGDTVVGRGQGGAVGPAAGRTDYAPWGGSIAFDRDYTGWYFGADASGIAAGQLDFYSEAQHELGHLLGFNTADSWFNKLSGNSFTGAAAESAFGGPVPTDPASPGHWLDGLVFRGSPTAMDPSVDAGKRTAFTELDYAGLKDIGWQTVAAVPAVPTVLGPTGPITNQQPAITWSASAGAARYQLWVDGAGQRGLINVSNLTGTSFTPAQPLALGTYTVWVRAFNSANQASAWSASKSFNIGVAPAVPTVLGPMGSITNQQPAITWSASAGAARYQLWVDGAGQRGLINVSTLTTTSFTPAQPLAAGTYTVWVRAFSSTNQVSAWSASMSFTVAVAPAVPTVLGPTGSIANQQPAITWSASAGATRYQLWVDGAGQRGLINVSNLTTTSFTPGQPLAAGTYTVWVRAFSSSNLASAWSASKSFTVAPAPSLGSQVVQFALSKLNTQVGGGECTDLAIAALQAAGAKTTFDFGVSGPDADYVWGTLIATYRPGDALSVLANVQPGDIIQYRNVSITSGFSQFSFPHHTSVVKENLGGGKLTILEQNVNNERWVHQTTQDLSGMTGGVVWIYRPVAK